MKKTKPVEMIGFALIVIGFIFMLLNGRIENNSFSAILSKYQLFYWGGLAIWAISYTSRETKEKKQQENGQNKLD